MTQFTKCQTSEQTLHSICEESVSDRLGLIRVKSGLVCVHSLLMKLGHYHCCVKLSLIYFPWIKFSLLLWMKVTIHHFFELTL